MPNIDLLHLARRLWRERLPSRTLLNLEAQILGFTRTEEDVPSWVIPQLYIDYLHTDDARLIKNIFYHNAKDILSMVTLYNHITNLLAVDLANEELPEIVISESIGRLEDAARIYQQSLNSHLPESVYLQILKKLSSLYKRLGDWSNAVILWKQAAKAGQVYAHIELAKYYEHREHDYNSALELTQTALSHLLNLDRPYQIDLDQYNSFEHRLERLKCKLG
jgi:tetratricopeptide (TPR) repeat protein